MPQTDELVRKSMVRGSPTARRTPIILFSAMILLGAASFVGGILGSEPERAWQVYLVNFVFWTGLCFGTILFSAILTITNARWGRPLKRLAEAPGAFLPISLPMFFIIFLGREKIFHWIHEPIPAKAGWLNVPFLFVRDGLGLFALTLLSLAIIYYSLKRDMDAVTAVRAPQESIPNSNSYERPLKRVATIYGILYAVILSLIAFDLIMSLNPHWYSSLFGAAYFIGSLYSGLAAVVILAALALKSLDLGSYIHPRQFHDLGKLTLGFCLMTGDFFFTQFFVIWYGNLPEETRFVILRTQSLTWKPFAWAVLIVAFAVPFVVLLSRKMKMKPFAMMTLSVVILAGMWMERFLLVVPSLWKGQDIPFGITEILITAGFFGTVALCSLLFLQRFPVLPVADPLFREYLETARERNRW